MNAEHPVNQPIREIDVYLSEEGGSTFYRVGKEGVTRIEACTKSGSYAAIPYVRVWKGDVCEAEFCQHNIVGVYFAPENVEETAPPPARGEFDEHCVLASEHKPGKPCFGCWMPF